MRIMKISWSSFACQTFCFLFLDLPKFELNSFKAHRMRKYSNINTETRKKLIDYFKPHNEQLYQLLDRNFGWN